MTIHRTLHGNEEFEVTEADKALVQPLGNSDTLTEEGRHSALAAGIKHFLKWHLGDQALPNGFWDAYPDEGEWVYNEELTPNDPRRTDDINPICVRGYDSAYDTVFVRLSNSVGDYQTLWDLQVHTRDGKGGYLEQAQVEVAEGGEYTPADCVRDLGTLLAVFRLFVQQGRI